MSSWAKGGGGGVLDVQRKAHWSLLTKNIYLLFLVYIINLVYFRYCIKADMGFDFKTAT